MREKRVGKWTGLLMTVSGLFLAGIITLSGSGQTEGQTSKALRSVSSSNGAVVTPGVARADSDTLELQLD